MARDHDTAQAIMRNARAAWRDQLRNQVRAGAPHLDDAEVETRVAELVSATRAAAGRKGAASVRRAAVAARYVLDRHMQVADMARALVTAIEALADPGADCTHDFDTHLEPYCRQCGAPYEAEQEVAA